MHSRGSRLRRSTNGRRWSARTSRTSSLTATRWCVRSPTRTKPHSLCLSVIQKNVQKMSTMFAPRDSLTKLQAFLMYLFTEHTFVTRAALCTLHVFATHSTNQVRVLTGHVTGHFAPQSQQMYFEQSYNSSPRPSSHARAWLNSESTRIILSDSKNTLLITLISSGRSGGLVTE